MVLVKIQYPHPDTKVLVHADVAATTAGDIWQHMNTLHPQHTFIRRTILGTKHNRDDSVLEAMREYPTLRLTYTLRKRPSEIAQCDLESGLIRLATHTEKLLATPASGWPPSLYNYADYSSEERVEFVRLVNANLRTGEEIKVEYDETATFNKLIYYHDSRLTELSQMLGLSQQALLDKAKNNAQGDDRVLVQLMFGDVEWILSGKSCADCSTPVASIYMDAYFNYMANKN
eukprot:19723-Heterococcus_DN1.PRE.2